MKQRPCGHDQCSHARNDIYRKVPPERPTISSFRGRIVEVVCCLEVIRHEPCTHIARFAVNPYLRADTSSSLSSTQTPAKCDLSTLKFLHRTNFVALCHTIFLPLAVKSRWGALARRGALAVLYSSSRTRTCRLFMESVGVYCTTQSNRGRKCL